MCTSQHLSDGLCPRNWYDAEQKLQQTSITQRISLGGLCDKKYTLSHTLPGKQPAAKLLTHFETMQVRLVCQSVVQTSKSRSTEQNSCCWRPATLIMHFHGVFFLDWPYVGNFCCWWKYWRCTAGGYFLALFYSEGIQFVYLDTAKRSKLEGSRDYEEVQFKVSPPIWGKVLCSLMSKKGREKCPQILSILEMSYSASHFLILVSQL